MPESCRTFIAIELPHELRGRVAAHIAQLRQALPHVAASWNREENLHLTLKFLGDVPFEKIEELSNAVAVAASQIKTFQLTVAGGGTFPPRGKPNVLWIGIEDASGSLAQLQRNLDDNCARIGFARESRTFHPHLTIARLRKPTGARDLGDAHRITEFPGSSFTVLEVVGLKSELLKTGAEHTPLFRHHLAALPRD